MIQKIKHISITIISILLITFVFSTVQIYAADEKRVYDNAALLSDEEEAALETQINTLKNQLMLDIVIVTIADSEGKTSRDYADDFYDYNGFGIGSNKDGLLFLIDMDNRQGYISTTGVAIDYFTDQRIESMLDDVIPHLKNKTYADAGFTFLSDVSMYVKSGIPSGQYRVDESEKGISFKRSFNRSPIYLIIALLIAGVSVGVMIYKNRGHIQTDRNTYLEKNSMQVLNRMDQHTGTHVSQTKIQSSSGGGGGGSSTHSSSSGSSHGGGGRGF